MASLSGHRAYLDSNTIIYALEGLADHANLKTGLLDLLDAGQFVAVVSQLTLVETIVGPRKIGNVDDEAMFRSFLTPSPNMVIEPVTLPVLEKVIELRVAFGLKTPDAIHVATGMLANCTTFVTRDASWARAGIPVMEPQQIT